MRIVLELRSGSQPLVVQNNLFKYTALQSSFSANMLAIVNGIPQVVNLKVILEHYLEYRKEIIKRKSEFELAKARERAHILAGLRIALSNLDEVIALIRASQDTESARNGLIERYGLDQPQAQAILDQAGYEGPKMAPGLTDEQRTIIKETLDSLKLQSEKLAKIIH